MSGEETYKASIEKFAIAAGIERIKVFDPYNLDEIKELMKTELYCGEPSVIIARRPCVLLLDRSEFKAYRVDPEVCRACGKCLNLGCPAIEKNTTKGDKWVSVIRGSLCTGCSVCAQVCPFDAIKE